MEFKDKIVLITGGGSGIGRATALLFAQEGAQLIIANRRREKGEETVELINQVGGNAFFYQTDLINPSEIIRLIHNIEIEFGKLDCAFNCGGIDGVKKKITELNHEDWDKIIDINLKGTYLLLKYEIKLMMKQRYGAIVNMSSVSAFFGRQGRSAYNTSRIGVIGLTRTAAMEFADYNIRINAVSPGAIDTDINARSTKGDPKILEAYQKLSPFNRLGKPEEVGHAVLWLCSDKASFITGEVLKVDGGASIYR